MRQREKLPSGFGTIRFLGEGRRRPYAVHPSAVKGKRPPAICYVSEWHVGVGVLLAWNAGRYTRGLEEKIGQEAAESRYTGIELDDFCSRLVRYARYFPGNVDALLKNACEAEMNVAPACQGKIGAEAVMDSARERDSGAEVVMDSARQGEAEARRNADPAPHAEEKVRPDAEPVLPAGFVSSGNTPSGNMSFFKGGVSVREVFERFYAYKFGPNAAKRLSPETAANARSIFRKLAAVEERRMDELRVDDLQEVVNSVGLGKTMVQKTVTLLRQLYRYALARELCTKNPAQYIVMPDVADHVHCQDFTDEELGILWAHAQDPVVRMVLIMCYSGFRIRAYETLETNLREGYFRGGVKTAAGKGRIVPIHSAIRPLVMRALEEDGGYLCGLRQGAFCIRMKRKMLELGIDDEAAAHKKQAAEICPGEDCAFVRKAGADGNIAGNGVPRHHTPHSCRHTFSRLCESYGVREADRRRMLGHSFGNDITNGVYGHRRLEELREEIEKIVVIPALPSG